MSNTNPPSSTGQPLSSPTTADGSCTPDSLNAEGLAPCSGDRNDDVGTLGTGCPGGSVSGGICAPYTNEHRSTWMSTYSGVRNLRIADAILPGTHNSGFDKEAPYSNSLETCQDVSPYKQLMTGIRAFDIRVQFFAGYQAGDSRRFMVYHGATSQRTIAGDYLDEILRFRTHVPKAGNPKREIIILDFHRFQDFTAAAHEELHQLIISRLGGILVSPWMGALTISQIWEYDLAIVIAYGDSQRNVLFWPGVNQRWIGEHTPSTDKLKQFMDEVVKEDKPYAELRTIQCAKYNKLLSTPDDFSDKIREWFFSADSHSYIQGFFIINTDWSLRHRLIDNCIHGSDVKQMQMGPSLEITVPQAESFKLPSSNRSLIARLINGSWARVISLPDFMTGDSTVLIKNSATYSTELVTTGTDYPLDSMVLHTGDVVSLSAVAGTAGFRFHVPTYLAEQGDSAIPVPRVNDRFIRYQLADGHFSERITLAENAPDSSVVEISSSAQMTATLNGSNLTNGRDISVPNGFSGHFIFHEQPKIWEQITLDPLPEPNLPAPEGLRIARVSYQPIELSWDPVPTAVKYRVYRWWTQIAQTTDTHFERFIEGYGRYHVRAVDAAGNVSPRTDYKFFLPQT